MCSCKNSAKNLQKFCRFFCKIFATFLQLFCNFFAIFLQFFCKFFAIFLQNFCKLIWDQDKRYPFSGYFQKRLLNDRFMTSSSFLFLKKFLHIFCKKFAKKLQKSCKKIAKKLQKSCKMRKRNFLLCKIFAKFLQILNLHTDFRPREESVTVAFSFG